jgi:hypothetical protein
MDSLVILIFALVGLYLTLWVIILLPARMAEARRRSAVGWVLVSIFFSPFLAVILLLLLGGSRRDES